MKNLIKDLTSEEDNAGAADASEENQTAGNASATERAEGQEEKGKREGTEDEDQHKDEDKAKDEGGQKDGDAKLGKSVQDASVAGAKDMEGDDKSPDADRTDVVQNDKKLIVAEAQGEKNNASGEVGTANEAEVASDMEGEGKKADDVVGAAGVEKGGEEGGKETGGGAGKGGAVETDGAVEEGGVKKGGEGMEEAGAQEEEMHLERRMRGRQ